MLQANVQEFTGPGVKILAVNATDADSGVNSIITYNLIVNPTGGFYIDPHTGRIQNIQFLPRFSKLCFNEHYCV